MRISDWSSDVCSSDLAAPYEHGHRRAGAAAAGEGLADTALEHAQTDAVAGDDLRETDVGRLRECGRLLQRTAVACHRDVVNVGHFDHAVRVAGRHRAEAPPDRKSVVSGKSVSVRVDLGGRPPITKKNHTSTTH